MKNNNSGMSLIVKTVTHLTVWLVLIYGAYISLRGHLSPGGSFAGGVIIALSFVQIVLAFGKDAVLKRIGEGRILSIASIAAASFLLLNILRGPLTLIDAAGALMVAAGLFLVFLTLMLLSAERETK